MGWTKWTPLNGVTQRVREWREKQKALQCNKNVTYNVTQEYRDKSIEYRNKEIEGNLRFHS